MKASTIKDCARMLPQQINDRTGFPAAHRLFGRRLSQRTPQIHRDDRRHRSDHEWNTPAPSLKLLCRQQHLQDSKYQKRQQLAPYERHVLEGRIEAPISLRRYLAHVGGSSAILPANRKALCQSGDE